MSVWCQEFIMFLFASSFHKCIQTISLWPFKAVSTVIYTVILWDERLISNGILSNMISKYKENVIK